MKANRTMYVPNTRSKWKRFEVGQEFLICRDDTRTDTRTELPIQRATYTGGGWFEIKETDRKFWADIRDVLNQHIQCAISSDYQAFFSYDALPSEE